MIAEQRVCKSLVEREVICCVSALVGHFVKHPEFLEGSGTCDDDLISLMISKDYENPVIEYVNDSDLSEVLEYLDDNEIEYDIDNETVTDLRSSMINNIRDNEGFEPFANDNGLDQYENEVLEHWAVSQWFAKKLEDKGEAVGKLFDFWVWGRCSSGQAIHLDSVIIDIASDLEKDCSL